MNFGITDRSGLGGLDGAVKRLHQRLGKMGVNRTDNHGLFAVQPGIANFGNGVAAKQEDIADLISGRGQTFDQLYIHTIRNVQNNFVSGYACEIESAIAAKSPE